MVVFTCNNCGESLQKPKVAKHYQFQCRRAPFLTCVDCFKDFRGDEYVAHTKCITENERYGGKDYIAKPGQNKGEKKQEAWINVVQNILTNSTNLTLPERNLLSCISKHENIPRKKAKFQNFIRNVSGNRVNMAIVESVWDKMEKAFKEASAQIDSEGQNDKQNTGKEENQNNSNICKESDNVEETDVINESNKTEDKKQKKSKKRKLEGEENGISEPATKKKNETDVTQEEVTVNGDGKFSWKNTILEIVTSKGELTLKKLKKKVIAQYLAHFPDNTPEKAASKFEKKLGKVSDILIDENKVKLVATS